MRLTRDREWATEALLDSCTVYGDDADAAPVFDEDLGHVVYPTDGVIWQGDCSVSAGVYVAGYEAPGLDPTAVSAYVVRVPLAGTETIDVGHIVVVDRVHPTGDQSLLGVRLVVETVGRRTSAVLRRLRCTVRSETVPR
jgi:hypothetical protein